MTVPTLRAYEREGRPPAHNGANRMWALAESYPELRVFTPDATLTEIKTRHGLDTLDQVRELGQRRLREAPSGDTQRRH
jgi:hypothetical protein